MSYLVGTLYRGAGKPVRARASEKLTPPARPRRPRRARHPAVRRRPLLRVRRRARRRRQLRAHRGTSPVRSDADIKPRAARMARHLPEPQLVQSIFDRLQSAAYELVIERRLLPTPTRASPTPSPPTRSLMSHPLTCIITLMPPSTPRAGPHLVAEPRSHPAGERQEFSD